MVDKPAWLDTSAAEKILQDAWDVVRENPSDKHIPANVAARLANNLWVKKIPPTGIVNDYEGRLTIRCEYRRPLAIIAAGGVMVRVDEKAMVLPGRFLPSAREVQPGNCRHIQGIQGTPPAQGEIWNAADVQTALQLLKLIDSRPFGKEITAIDVSNYRGRVSDYRWHIVMYTEKHTELRWGRAIGMEGRIEVDYKTKLEHLNGLYLEYGSLNKLVYADLRGRKVGLMLRNGQ